MASGAPAAVGVGDGDLLRVRPERQLVAADADALAGDAGGGVGGEEDDQRRRTSSAVPKPSPLRSASGSGVAVLFRASTCGAKAGMVLVIAVAATGMTALTVMLALASSIAQVRTIAAMPALAAA